MYGPAVMREGSNRFLITVAMMSATVMQALDTTIVNVALPHMAGNLGASMDQVSWVLTSYLIAASVVMPLTGYLSDRFGQRRFLLWSIGGFVIASGLCGIAQNLAEMVGFRLLQGLFGASLIPLSQAVMAHTYPPHERGKAMAIWGMGVMVAPILGPTLGGWLTEVVSWRWTFYINLPVGALSFFLAATYVPDTPTRSRDLDWVGFAALALSLCALQVTLDRGEQDDWLSSPFIVSMAVTSVLLFVAFVWRTLTNRRDPLFNLAVLKDRNFVLACTIMFAMGIGLFGGMLLQPMFLENLLGYPTTEAGLDLMPRGLATLAAMILISRISTRVAPKTLLTAGVLFSIVGSYWMTRMSPDIGGGWMAFPLSLQGFGLGLIFVPASTIAFATIPKALSRPRPRGSTASSARWARRSASRSSRAISCAPPRRTGSCCAASSTCTAAPSSTTWARCTSPPGRRTWAPDAGGAGRAGAVGLLDTFWLVTASFAAMLPLLLFMRRTRPGGSAPVVAE
ncbi:MAG: DHA2 family efflux MFS transporter permease subunit [Chthoniobacteraceae bacterium]